MSTERYIAERLAHNRMKNKIHEAAEFSIEKDKSRDFSYRLKELANEINDLLYTYSETGDILECRDILYNAVRDSQSLLDAFNQILINNKVHENEDLSTEDDPGHEEPVKLKYISDTWNMIDKYDIKDWEDHDSYISVSKDSYEKMLNGSKNKRYIMNLRLK